MLKATEATIWRRCNLIFDPELEDDLLEREIHTAAQDKVLVEASSSQAKIIKRSLLA